jgi:hypothetical protein
MPKGKHQHDGADGPQQRYKWGGYGSVWRWALGHGIHRWIKARNWARRRAKQAKNPAGFKKADEAYTKRIKWIREHNDPKPPHSDGSLIVTVDGKPVAGWIGRAALAARAAGAWSGVMLSGFRSPEYSEQLCYGICGQPSCPGLCAGRASNHSCPPTATCKPYEGAGDFTDAARLCAWCRAHGIPLHGGGEFLPNDVNHCSYSGR